MTTEPMDLQALPLEHARTVFPPLWVITHDTTLAGYPFRLRIWWGMTPEPRWQVCTSLDAARRVIDLQGGCVKFAPQQGDPPDVVETWL